MGIILIGPSGAGKTTLVAALTGSKRKILKTQTIEFKDSFIDTPGEYLHIPIFHRPLIDTANRARVVVLVQDATANRVGFPPGFARTFNRPVLGLVTKVDHKRADPQRATRWLDLAGVAPERVLLVSALEGKGMAQLEKTLAEMVEEKEHRN